MRNLNKYNLEKSNQNIYSFDSLLLSIKTKRDKLIDISIADKNKLKKISNNIEEYNLVSEDLSVVTSSDISFDDIEVD